MDSGLGWPLDRVVVVGASLAGLRACETLRVEGFGGTIVLVGAEPHRPYDRPPLSKRFLSGEWDRDRIALRKDAALDSLGLDLRLGVPAAGLDTTARAVTLADGSEIAYDGVIIATGTHARRLPGTVGHPLVHELRTLDDATRLRDRLAEPGRRLVIIGAGFIGLEVAATARKAGAEVVVLEAAPAPLIRGVGAELGTHLASFHDEHGVEIRCGVGVERIGDDGVHLTDGTLVPADAVLVGIGVSPNTGWLEDSGLEVRDGVVTAPTLAAGPPGVFAAGDVVRWTNPRFGAEMRVEHWTNASEQGTLAAENLLAAAAGGELSDSAEVPFVWSDQYSRRIQFLGRSTPR